MKSKKVLLNLDDIFETKAIQRKLESNGYEVLNAKKRKSDMATFLESIEDIDTVIVDKYKRELAVHYWINDNLPQHKTHIIGLTSEAHPDQDDIYSEIVKKPYATSEILDIVNKLVGNQ
jgi:PleD family two-component response regulator